MNLSLLDKFQEKNILVVGDYCIDEFLHGEVMGISPEAPRLRVVGYEGAVRLNPGMTGNIVAGIKALGANCYAVGVIGPVEGDEEDYSSRNLIKMFNKRGINSEGMILQENRWTPRFVRVIAGGAKYPAQHGDRFDFENSNPIEDSTAKRIIDYIDRMKGNIDAIIAADYNEFGKGIINKSLLDKVREIAKARKITLIGDSRQGFENFYGFTCIKPNISEARQLCSVGAHSIDDLAWRIENRLNLSSILISMDKDGMYLLTKSGIKKELPSYAKKVVDVTGAGDSVISAFTLALVSGFGYEDSAQLAGYAAAISVSKPGVDVVFLNELKQFAENEK